MFTQRALQKVRKFFESERAAKLCAATATVGLLYAGSRSPVKEMHRNDVKSQDFNYHEVSSQLRVTPK